MRADAARHAGGDETLEKEGALQLGVHHLLVVGMLGLRHVERSGRRR